MKKQAYPEDIIQFSLWRPTMDSQSKIVGQNIVEYAEILELLSYYQTHKTYR